MVKPSKGGEDDIRYKRDLEEMKPKVTRNIILIRHGQYNLAGRNDAERYLTEKGIDLCLPYSIAYSGLRPEIILSTSSC